MGRGGNQTGAIAAGCGAIYCMVCFFLFGVPLLIGGIIAVRVGSGAYDDEAMDSIEDCCPSYSRECDDDCMTWDEWEDVKHIVKIVGIVFIIVSLLSVLIGIGLILLMFTSLCKKQQPVGIAQQPNMQMAQPIYVYDNQAAFPVQQGYAHPGYTQQGYAEQGYPAQTGFAPPSYDDTVKK